MEIHFSHVLGTAWISASSKKFQKPLTLKCLCFPIFFPYYGNSLFPYFGNCMDFCFTQNIWEIHNSGMFVFSHTFSILWEFTFPIFWELYGFLLHPKYLRNLLLWNVCVFPYFSLTIAIHFLHILGIVWISASLKIVEKPITLECLFFPILFPYYGNSLFPCFGNCMDFCFTRNILETHKFEMFVFSHTFPVLWKSTFPMFWELHGYLLQAKNSRNP